MVNAVGRMNQQMDILDHRVPALMGVLLYHYRNT